MRGTSGAVKPASRSGVAAVPRVTGATVPLGAAPVVCRSPTNSLRNVSEVTSDTKDDNWLSEAVDMEMLRTTCASRVGGLRSASSVRCGDGVGGDKITEGVAQLGRGRGGENSPAGNEDIATELGSVSGGQASSELIDNYLEKHYDSISFRFRKLSANSRAGITQNWSISLPMLRYLILGIADSIAGCMQSPRVLDTGSQAARRHQRLESYPSGSSASLIEGASKLGLDRAPFPRCGTSPARNIMYQHIAETPIDSNHHERARDALTTPGGVSGGLESDVTRPTGTTRGVTIAGRRAGELSARVDRPGIPRCAVDASRLQDEKRIMIEEREGPCRSRIRYIDETDIVDILNNGDKEELCRLNYIGEGRADFILATRRDQPFRNLRDLGRLKPDRYFSFYRFLELNLEGTVVVQTVATAGDSVE